jgi:uncharacterized membrane protein
MKNIAKINESKDYVHIGFEIGILIKGIDGLLEVIGGILLLFLSPIKLNKLVVWLTQHELSEDPKDRIANLLLAVSQSFSIGTQYFGVFYLVTHGIIKCILILLLWNKKLWAYPLTILSLMLFIAYQIYRYTITQSFLLVLLTIFDVVMIALTYIEYRKIKIRLVVKESLENLD